MSASKAQSVERSVYEWYDVRRLRSELVCQLLVVGDQMRNIHVAVVLLDKNVFADLIPVV